MSFFRRLPPGPKRLQDIAPPCWRTSRGSFSDGTSYVFQNLVPAATWGSLPRMSEAGALSGASPSRAGLPHLSGRSASLTLLSRAGFTRVAACWIARPPMAAFVM